MFTSPESVEVLGLLDKGSGALLTGVREVVLLFGQYLTETEPAAEVGRRDSVSSCGAGVGTCSAWRDAAGAASPSGVRGIVSPCGGLPIRAVRSTSESRDVFFPDTVVLAVVCVL